MDIMAIVKSELSVSERFCSLCGNIKLTDDQRADGQKKHHGVCKCLNSHYYKSSSESANSRLLGSWAKSTAIRPPRDIDVLFVLPHSVYDRYLVKSGNRQSQILQEVKSVLQATYSSTKMRGDGQVVVVPFASYAVEVVPAFLLEGGTYWICDTHSGGSYKTIDPFSEAFHVSYHDNETKGNVRNLIRMMKCWQAYCNVPMKSFWLELLSIEFLIGWEYADKGMVYYDWMVRDFFNFLLGKVWGSVTTYGTSEMILLGNDWESKAKSAYNRAVKAIEYQSGGYRYLSGDEWQKIFGTDIPV